MMIQHSLVPEDRAHVVVHAEKVWALRMGITEQFAKHSASPNLVVWSCDTASTQYRVGGKTYTSACYSGLPSAPEDERRLYITSFHWSGHFVEVEYLGATAEPLKQANALLDSLMVADYPTLTPAQRLIGFWWTQGEALTFLKNGRVEFENHTRSEFDRSGTYRVHGGTNVQFFWEATEYLPAKRQACAFEVDAGNLSLDCGKQPIEWSRR
jgi:hypothetical protein